MKKRPDSVSVQDMAQAARLAQTFLKRISKEELTTDLKTQAALCRQLEIIGEAATRVSVEFRKSLPSIPWKKIIGMRNILTNEDKIVIQTWAQLVQEKGPEALLSQPGMWADHALYGEWRGYRASSFSHSGRIIYKIEENIITVIVVRITSEHDYKKKEK